MNPKRVKKDQPDDVKEIQGVKSNVELPPKLESSHSTSN